MTLILFAKGKDGLVLVSDKQGSVEGGEKIIVKKIFLSKNKNYILSLAGDGNRIEQIYALLQTLSIKKQDIEQKINSIISMTYEKNSSQVEGILLVKNKEKYKISRIATDHQKVIILPYDAPFACFGLNSGKTIATFFSQFINIEKSTLRHTAEFLISSLDVISQNYDGIGTINNGFDVLIIKNNGDIIQNSRFINNGFGKIKFILEKSQINILDSVSSKQIPKKKKIKLSKKEKIVQHSHEKLPDFTKIKLPDLSIIDLTKIDLPKVSQIDFSKLDLPKVSQIDFSKLDLPKVSQIDFSKLDLPKVSQIDFSKLDLPKVSQIDFSKLDLPKVSQIDFSKLDLPKVSQIDFSKLDLPKVSQIDFSKLDLPKVSQIDFSKLDLPKVDVNTKSKFVCHKCEKSLKTKNEIDIQTCTKCNENSDKI